jgi:PmbA protein
MTRSDAKSLLDKVLDAASGREVEVILGGGHSGLTRFANNQVTQNVSERRYVLSVRTLVGRRTGRASGNDLTPSGIQRLMNASFESARLQPENPDLPSLPEPQSYRTVAADDPDTAAFGPEARARGVAEAISRCQASGLEAAGIFETGQGTIGDYGEIAPLAIANSRGLFAYHNDTSATFRVSALDGAASGWAGKESHRVRDVSGAALAERASEKALRSRDPLAWEPGRYTVVLEPAAVADLLTDMSWISLGALAVQEGRSFLSGRIGEQVLGQNVTLRDDPYHPLHQGCPFDGEGMPTLATTIVDRGIAVGPVYDRQTAAREGRESTGHGLPAPNTLGPVATNLVLEGGAGSVDRLIAGVEKGLLVTRVWYTNVVDPKTATLTGMTRDGLFAIERGRVTRAVRNFRFNQSIVEMLREVEDSSEVELTGGVVCPALRVRSFHMSSVTEF